MSARDYSDHQLDAIATGLKAGEPIEKVLATLPAKPKTRLKNNNEESRSQKMLIKWWSHRCKDFDIPEQLLFSIPNGMAFGGKAEWQVKTSIIRGKNAKLEGLRPGVPDLMLAVPSGQQGVFSGKNDVPIFKYAGMFIEMKTATGVEGMDQFYMRGYLLSRGYHCVLCRSTDEAIKAIESYLS